MQTRSSMQKDTETEVGTESADTFIYNEGYGDLRCEDPWNKQTFGGRLNNHFEHIYFDKPGNAHRKGAVVGKSLLARRVVLDHRHNGDVVTMCKTCLESELPCDLCYERFLQNVVGMKWADGIDYPSRNSREEVLKFERGILKEFRKETWAMDEFTRTTLKKLTEEFDADRFHPISPTSPFVRGSSLTEPGNLKLVECSGITAISKTYDKVSDEQKLCYQSRLEKKEEHVVNMRYNFYIPCDEKFVVQIFGSPPESLTDADVQYIFFLHSQLDSARELVSRTFPGYKLTGFVDCLYYVGFLEFVKEDFIEEWNDMYAVIEGYEDTGSITDRVTEDRMFRLNQLTSFERFMLFTDKGKHQIYNSVFYSDNVGIYVDGAWKVVTNDY